MNAAIQAAIRQAVPEILLTYQKKLLVTVSENAVTICEKSRRIGVTWGIGSLAVTTSGASREAGGMDTLYIGYNLDMAREFIDVCGQWAKAFNQACDLVGEFLFRDGDRDIQAFRISFASGFEIVALASRPRSLRGRQGFVIIDEAANCLTMGKIVWSKLRVHPKVVKGVFPNGTGGGMVTRQQFADLFEVQEIRVGESFVNGNRKGQAAAMKRVWGGHLAGHFIDPTASNKAGVTWGLTMQYGQKVAGTQADGGIGAWGGQRVRVIDSVCELVVSKDAGFLIQNAV